MSATEIVSSTQVGKFSHRPDCSGLATNADRNFYFIIRFQKYQLASLSVARTLIFLPLIVFISDCEFHDRIGPLKFDIFHVYTQTAFHRIVNIRDKFFHILALSSAARDGCASLRSLNALTGTLRAGAVAVPLLARGVYWPLFMCLARNFPV